jgi:predicted Fe-S protein YdhL (DUF1289 family)
MKPVRTPCIGVCSTTSLGDRICRGCKRFSHEVIHWNAFTEPQKQAQVLQDFRVFYDPDLSPYFWLHQLLQKHLYRLQGLAEIGVELVPSLRGRDLRDLLLQINEELQALSEAHHERYFRQ